MTQNQTRNHGMTADALNIIVRRWEMGNQFLAAYLRRSVDSIKSYRFGRRAIPQRVGEMMVRLRDFLESGNQPPL